VGHPFEEILSEDDFKVVNDVGLVMISVLDGLVTKTSFGRPTKNVNVVNESLPIHHPGNTMEGTRLSRLNLSPKERVERQRIRLIRCSPISKETMRVVKRGDNVLSSGDLVREEDPGIVGFKGHVEMKRVDVIRIMNI
jgi:hypothetical protein